MDRATRGTGGEDRWTPSSSQVRRSSRARPWDDLPPRTGQYRPDRSATPRLAGTRATEDRYRPGGRRTAAEPLSASWRPWEETAGRPKRRPPAEARKGKGYGWRIYAVPILVVLTALVVFKTASSPPTPAGGAPTAGAPGGGGASDAVNENPVKPLGLDIPTAPLPGGGDFTQSGAQTYHIIPVSPGRGKRVGVGGKLYTYTVEVEDGIDSSSYDGDDAFANSVENTLSDPRSWTGTGQVSFQRVDGSAPAPDFRVSLTTPNTDHRPDVCGFLIPYEASCYSKTFDHRVVINLARWVRGALAFNGEMDIYRKYAINHEVGHAVGNGHVGCPDNGALAPVMMQQTFGVENDYVSDLNKVDPSNYSAVAHDGKVCQINAWPNPQVAAPNG